MNFLKNSSFLVLLMLVLGGCSSSASQANPVAPATELSARATTIPVFSNSATTTVLYIYNDSDQRIDNIDYSVSGNQLESANQLIIGSECREIAAHSHCGLRITTPWLSEQENQGSSLVTARYAGKQSSSWLINYKLVARDNRGLQFSESQIITAEHGTVYAYNSSPLAQKITEFSHSGVIIDGSTPPIVVGSSVESSAVIALAVSAGTGNQARTLTLGSEGKTRYSNSATLRMTISNGAILAPFLLPPFNNKGVSGDYQCVDVVTNIGNAAATGLTWTGDSNIGVGSIGAGCGGTLGGTLAVGAKCGLCYHVNSTATSGSGSLSVTYGGAVSGYSPLTIPVYWYNLYQTPLVSVNAPTALINSGESMIVTMVLQNIGSFNLSSLAASYTSVKGYTTLTPLSTTCTNNQTATLQPNSGNSCTINFRAKQTTALDDQVKVIISGSYGSSQTYSRALLISILDGVVTTTSGGIATTVGVESSAVVTITNNSAMTFANESVTVNYTDSSNVTITKPNPTITCSGASNTLPPGGTCTYSVSGIESVVGTANIYSTVTATAGGTTYQISARTPISTSMYVYISNWGNSPSTIVTCSVNSDGTFNNASCQTQTGLGNRGKVFQIYIYKGYLYIGADTPVVCSVSSYMITNCVTFSPSIPNTVVTIIPVNGHLYFSNWQAQPAGILTYATNNPLSSPSSISNLNSNYLGINGNSQIMQYGTTGNSKNILYVPASVPTNTVYQMLLNADGSYSGTVTNVTGVCPTGYTNIYGSILSSDGNYLYLACWNSGTATQIVACPINSGGSLTSGTVCPTAATLPSCWVNGMAIQSGYFYATCFNAGSTGNYIARWQLATPSTFTTSSPLSNETANGTVVNPDSLFFRNGAALN